MPEIRNMSYIGQGTVHIASVQADEVRMMHDVQNRVIHSQGVPAGGSAGDLLVKKTGTDYDTEWVAPATAVEQDNTRPITSAAVYTEVGNINALLATI